MIMQGQQITRRQAIQTLTLSTAALALAAQGGLAQEPARAGAAPTARADGPFTLPPLPYAYSALEPHIDTLTMQIHHDKHHAKYVENLNKALAQAPNLKRKSVEDLLRDQSEVPVALRAAVRNNAGGHYNHSLFWQTMSQGGGGAPKGTLADAIDKRFGSYDAFKAMLSEEALARFGSGWAWLSVDPSGQLLVESTPNQDSPLSRGRTPLLGIDVWEHAYYLKYQNRRADYVAAFFNVIAWDAVAQRFGHSARS